MPVYRDNRRGKYYYSFSYKGSRVRSRDYDTRRECEKALASALLNKKTSNGLTFDQITALFLAEKKDRLKTQSYDRLAVMLGHFNRTLGDVRVDKLTTEQYANALRDIDSFTFHGKPLKNSYKNKLIRTFKQLCQFAGRRYDVYTNIPDKFDNYRNEEREEMKIITLEQFQRLLDVCNDEPWRTLFIVLFYMGLRVGEANALTWSDVDLNAPSLTVRKTLSTKLTSADGHYLITSPKTKSSNRTLPLPHVVFTALSALYDKSYKAHEKPSETFVFGGLSPVPESSLQKIKNKYFDMAELPRIRLHDFRHSCASFLINNGATPLLVSKWLGHANVTMTLNTYAHLWRDELQEIVRKIDEKS